MTLLDRLAGAPITWGVDGSPGWGYLMDRERVLSEMAGTGLRATELGPDGYLPSDPSALREYLDERSLSLVGGFVPAVLYRAERAERDLEYVRRASRLLAAAGSLVMVLGPATDQDGYDHSVELSDAEWSLLLANLKRVTGIAAESGLRTALHPHWGMAVEKARHVERVLDGSDSGLCLDTGHLYLAGADPVAVAKQAVGRVHHVHLKDVDGALAARVRSGQARFRQSVIEGMFVPLGAGAVDIAGVISTLEATGYQGWYVLEQDVSLDREPAPGAGPVADAEASVTFLRGLADRIGPS
jgi:inosose dehydratase